jgi:hypothetical protein
MLQGDVPVIAPVVLDQADTCIETPKAPGVWIPSIVQGSNPSLPIHSSKPSLLIPA